MKVEHFGGRVELSADDAVDSVLEQRFGGRWNEYWVSGDEKYPALAILVAGDTACVHYFPEDGHPGFISVSKNNNAQGTVEFRTNTIQEKIEVPKSAVVPLSDARGVFIQFLENRGELPSAIEWLEL